MSARADARDVLDAAAAPRQAPVFDAGALHGFAQLRQAHVNLFAAHMRLETAFPRLEPPDRSFDARSFCDHLPAAFRGAEADVGRLSRALDETAAAMTALSRRLQEGPPPGPQQQQQQQHQPQQRPLPGGGSGGPPAPRAAR